MKVHMRKIRPHVSRGNVSVWACNVWDLSQIGRSYTNTPKEVTCGNCKRTKFYKRLVKKENK